MPKLQSDINKKLMMTGRTSDHIFSEDEARRIWEEINNTDYYSKTIADAHIAFMKREICSDTLMTSVEVIIELAATSIGLIIN